MHNLSDLNVSYILFSPEKNELSQIENKKNCEKALSILYPKDYTITPVKGYYEGVYENSFIASPKINNNDDLRHDAILILDTFSQDSVIVKYQDEEFATKIDKSGEEFPLSIALYNGETKNKTYLYNGLSFTFLEKKRYFFPKTKNDLKVGMLVEYLNEKNWYSKTVTDLTTQYDNLWSLLIKYNKLRIPY